MNIKQGIVIVIVALLSSACTITTTTTTTVPTSDYVYYSNIYGYTPLSTTFGFSYGPGFGYSTRSYYGYSFGF